MCSKPTLLILAFPDLYYLAFPEDRALNKALVYGVSFLETVQAMFLLSEGILVYDIASRHDSLFSIEPSHPNRWVPISTYSAISLIGGIGMSSEANIINFGDLSLRRSCLCCPNFLCISPLYSFALVGGWGGRCFCKLLAQS